MNYTALLRRHRTALVIIIGGTLVLSMVYTLLGHKVYRSEVILEVTGINQDFMDTKGVDPTASQVTGDAYIETQTKLLTSPPVVERTAAAAGSKGRPRHRRPAEPHRLHAERMVRPNRRGYPGGRAKRWC